MKTLFVLAGIALAMSATTSPADIRLWAPGVPVGAATATACPFKIDYTLNNSYKFVFLGIEAKGDTLGAPGSSGTNGNGGQINLKASASSNGGSGCGQNSNDCQSGGNARAGQITFRNVQDLNTSTLKTLTITPSVTYKATDSPVSVTLTWQGEGNAHKPNGIFNILGEYQKAPPVPVGRLTFAVGDYLLTAAGTQPPGTAVITRD